MLLLLFRGDDFQMAYSQIEDLHSILPERVQILALTATLTTMVFKAVKERLSLNDPAIIGISLDHPMSNTMWSQKKLLSHYVDY